MMRAIKKMCIILKIFYKYRMKCIIYIQSFSGVIFGQNLYVLGIFKVKKFFIGIKQSLGNRYFQYGLVENVWVLEFK